MDKNVVHFYIFQALKMQLVFYNNTKEENENECQSSQNYISHMKFPNFFCVFTILVKFNILFLGLPWEIFFGVITDDYLHL